MALLLQTAIVPLQHQVQLKLLRITLDAPIQPQAQKLHAPTGVRLSPTPALVLTERALLFRIADCLLQLRFRIAIAMRGHLGHGVHGELVLLLERKAEHAMWFASRPMGQRLRQWPTQAALPLGQSHQQQKTSPVFITLMTGQQQRGVRIAAHARPQLQEQEQSPVIVLLIMSL
jgi:hypothetical protein